MRLTLVALGFIFLLSGCVSKYNAECVNGNGAGSTTPPPPTTTTTLPPCANRYTMSSGDMFFGQKLVHSPPGNEVFMEYTIWGRLAMYLTPARRISAIRVEGGPADIAVALGRDVGEPTLMNVTSTEGGVVTDVLDTLAVNWVIQQTDCPGLQ